MKARSLSILLCVPFVSIGCAGHSSYYGGAYPQATSAGVNGGYVIERGYTSYYDGSRAGTVHNHGYRDRRDHHYWEHQSLNLHRPHEYRKPLYDKHDRHHEREFGQRNREREHNELRHQDRQFYDLDREANHHGHPAQARPSFSQHRHNEARDRFSSPRKTQEHVAQRIDNYDENSARKNRDKSLNRRENAERKRWRVKADRNWGKSNQTD